MSSLPKIEYAFKFVPIIPESFALPEINYRPYNTSDERALIMKMSDFKESQKMDNDLVSFLKGFIETCIIDKDVYNDVKDKMSYINFLWLMFSIRACSKSNAFSKHYKCPKCGVDNEIKFDIKNDIKVDFDQKDFMINCQDFGVSFVLRVPSIETFVDIMSIEEIIKSTESIEKDNELNPATKQDQLVEMTQKALQAMDKVIFNIVDKIIVDKDGDVNIYNGFEFDEFVEFIGALPVGVNDAFKEAFKKLPQFKAHKETKCKNPKCDHTFIDDIEGVASFLS